MQTQGRDGLGILRDRVSAYGVGSLWWGAWATAAANFVGSFPWFAVYNALQANLPPQHALVPRLLRQAFIGFAASIVSDTVSNSIRVVKTYRQVNQSRISYSMCAPFGVVNARLKASCSLIDSSSGSPYCARRGMAVSLRQRSGNEDLGQWSSRHPVLGTLEVIPRSHRKEACLGPNCLALLVKKSISGM